MNGPSRTVHAAHVQSHWARAGERRRRPRGRYHGGRRPSSDESFHSPTVIPPSALEHHKALPSSTNDEVRCDCTFADNRNASWYSVCRLWKLSSLDGRRLPWYRPRWAQALQWDTATRKLGLTAVRGQLENRCRNTNAHPGKQQATWHRDLHKWLSPGTSLKGEREGGGGCRGRGGCLSSEAEGLYTKTVVSRVTTSCLTKKVEAVSPGRPDWRKNHTCYHSQWTGCKMWRVGYLPWLARDHSQHSVAETTVDLLAKQELEGMDGHRDWPTQQTS